MTKIRERLLAILVTKLFFHFLLAGCILLPAVALPKKLSHEDVAALVAENINKHPENHLDDITVAVSAVSHGKNVIVTYTIWLKPDLTTSELTMFFDAVKKEGIARICANKLEKNMFRWGIWLTFKYEHPNGKKFGGFDLRKHDCKY